MCNSIKNTQYLTQLAEDDDTLNEILVQNCLGKTIKEQTILSNTYILDSFEYHSYLPPKDYFHHLCQAIAPVIQPVIL